MARYEITSPNGQRYEINAPDTASESDVMAYAKQQFASLDTAAPPMDTTPPDPGRTGSFAAPNLQVGVAEDAGKGFASGLARGAVGVGSLPGTVENLGRKGINWAAGKMGADGPVVNPTPALPQYSDALKSLEENVTGPLYDPKTRTGKFANAIGEFAPGVMLPGAQAGMAARVIGNVVAPAIGSELAGQLTEGTAAEPYARVAGSLVGPAIAARAVTPFRGDPTRAAEAAVLRNEGVTSLTAGQETGRMPLRWVESAIRDTPFTGARAANMNTEAAEQFTRAALRRAGIDAPRATQDVIDAGFTRIGQNFEQVANAVTIPVNGSLQRRAADIVRRYERVTEPSLVNPLPANIANDIAGRTGRVLDGATYQAWRSDISAAARGAGDPRTERALYDLRNLLDQRAAAYLRQNGQGDLARQIAVNNREYRAMLAIAKASSAAGENAANGLISPAALKSAAQAQNPQQYSRGRGDFARLANAGNAILRELPQSGTAPRLIATELGKVMGGSLIGAGMGGSEGAAYGGLGTLAAQALMGRAIMSRPSQAYLRNQANGRAAINQGGLLSRMVPGVSEFSDKRDNGGRF